MEGERGNEGDGRPDIPKEFNIEEVNPDHPSVLNRLRRRLSHTKPPHPEADIRQFPKPPEPQKEPEI